MTPAVLLRPGRTLGWWGVFRSGVIGAAVLIVLNVGLAGDGYQLYLVTSCLIWATLALSLNVLFGMTGQLSLGHAAFMAVGAYAYTILVNDAGWAPLIGVLGAVGCSSFIALAFALPILRLRHHYLALATVALSLIVYSLANNLIDLTGGPNGRLVPQLEVAGWTAGPGDVFWIAGTFLIVCFVCVSLLADGRIGRGWLMVRDQQDAAAGQGINTYLVRVSVFVATAAVASIGGILLAMTARFASPENFSILTSVEVLMAVLVGGAGRLLGPLIGGIFVVYAHELTGPLADYDEFIFAVILFVTVVFMPAGVAGSVPDLVARVRRRPIKASESRAHDDLTAEGDDVIAVRRDEPLDVVQALQVTGLSKRFNGLQAVADLDMTVPAGQVTALIGPNGAGKSTAFKMITGSVRADSGSWRVGDDDLTGRRAHAIARLGLRQTYQTPALAPTLSVLENVAIGAYWTDRRPRGADLAPHGARERDVLRRASAACLRVGLDREILQRSAGSLTLGNQRLVEVARALVSGPRFVLMDEPGANLNLEEKERLATVIQDMKLAGIGVLLVDHEMRLVMTVADRVYVVNQGRLICSGTPEVVQRDPVVIEAYLGREAVRAESH